MAVTSLSSPQPLKRTASSTRAHTEVVAVVVAVAAVVVVLVAAVTKKRMAQVSVAAYPDICIPGRANNKLHIWKPGNVFIASRIIYKTTSPQTARYKRNTILVTIQQSPGVDEPSQRLLLRLPDRFQVFNRCSCLNNQIAVAAVTMIFWPGNDHALQA